MATHQYDITTGKAGQTAVDGYEITYDMTTTVSPDVDAATSVDWRLQLEYRGTDDEVSVGVRLEGPGGKILAAADSGGTYELSPVRTGNVNYSNWTGTFTYVDTAATDNDWENVLVRFIQNINTQMAADAVAYIKIVPGTSPDTSYFTLNYTPSGASLSLPTQTDITAFTATVGCTSDTASGTLYYYISTSATPPSSADLKAGTGAVDAGSTGSVIAGANTFSATGLSASTTYYTHFIQDVAGSDSTILTSSSWTTDVAREVACSTESLLLTEAAASVSSLVGRTAQQTTPVALELTEAVSIAAVGPTISITLLAATDRVVVGTPVGMELFDNGPADWVHPVELVSNWDFQIERDPALDGWVETKISHTIGGVKNETYNEGNTTTRGMWLDSDPFNVNSYTRAHLDITVDPDYDYEFEFIERTVTGFGAYSKARGYYAVGDGPNTNLVSLTRVPSYDTVHSHTLNSSTGVIRLIFENFGGSYVSVFDNVSVIAVTDPYHWVDKDSGLVRRVRGFPQEFALTTSAATVEAGAADRTVSCTTETLALSPAAATVNQARGVTCTTEALSLSVNTATVVKDTSRDVTATAEALQLATNTALVTKDADVVAATEALSLGVNTAAVQQARDVAGAVESLQIVESAASISVTRDVSGTTEALSLAANPANLSKTKTITGSTEQMALSVAAATVLKKHVVSVVPDSFLDGETGVVITVEDISTAGAKVYIGGDEQTITGTTANTITITTVRGDQSIGAAELMVVEL